MARALEIFQGHLKRHPEAHEAFAAFAQQVRGPLDEPFPPEPENPTQSDPIRPLNPE